MQTGFTFIYVTVPTLGEAQEIGRTLVEKKLAGCVNILPQMHSIYRWQDQVEEAEEIVLIVKTRAELFDEVKDHVNLMHPYDCPCIVALPVEAGHQVYLDWLRDGTLN